MNSPEFRRCGTLLTAAADAGRKVAFITAKEKLRTVLGDGIVERGGIVFSSEKVDEAEEETHGVSMMRNRSSANRGRRSTRAMRRSTSSRPARRWSSSGRASDFLYLSLTDFMQHKYVPDAPESLDFHEKMDAQIGRLLAAGCVVAA